MDDIMTGIGLVAGKIWKYLDENKEANDLELKLALDIPSNKLVLLAIGWLLREDKLVLKENNKTYVVSLKK